MSAAERHPETSSRRGFLQTTACGIGGMALESLLRGDATAASSEGPYAIRAPHFAPKAKSCIFLMMAGGPSQMDLFDPKPMLAKRDGEPLPKSLFTDKTLFTNLKPKSATLMGSRYGFRKYGESGLEFSELLPRIASCADDIAQIRSLHTDEFNHQQGVVMLYTGRGNPGRPSMGSWMVYGLGSEARNLPAYVVLGDRITGSATPYGSGFLPSSYGGTSLRHRGVPILDLQTPAGVSRKQQRETLDTIADLNRQRLERTGDDEIESRISAYELAFRMQMSAPELMDLSGESPATLEAYGVDRTEKGFQRSPSDELPIEGRFSSYALKCLLARRLVERGVPFVNISVTGWDHHTHLSDQLPFYARMVDQPVAALLQDLEQRGLLDETLVVWGTEFGRTPVGENAGQAGRAKAVNTGRDHHPFSFTMWMAGGGVKGGTVVGQTDDLGWFPVEDPVHMNDFHATLLHLFGLDHERLSVRVKGLDVRLTDVGGHVVQKLLA